MKISAIVHWTLAACCLAFCVKQMGLALKISSFASAPHLLFGFASFIAALLLLSPDTVRPLAELFSRLFTSFIYPESRHRKPPLSYRMARVYRQQMRYFDSFEEYRKIILYYPDEQDAYLEIIALSQQRDDHRQTRKYSRLFERRFCRAVTPPLPTLE